MAEYAFCALSDDLALADSKPQALVARFIASAVMSGQRKSLSGCVCGNCRNWFSRLANFGLPLSLPPSNTTK